MIKEAHVDGPVRGQGEFRRYRRANRPELRPRYDKSGQLVSPQPAKLNHLLPVLRFADVEPVRERPRRELARRLPGES